MCFGLHLVLTNVIMEQAEKKLNNKIGSGVQSAHSVTKRVSIIDGKEKRFMEVFELEVWICILIAYISTSLLMWVFDKWSPYSYQNNMEKYQVQSKG